MKEEGKRTEQALVSALRGDNPPRRKRKWRKLERRINRLKQNLLRGGLNLEEFWSVIVHVTHEFQ